MQVRKYNERDAIIICSKPKIAFSTTETIIGLLTASTTSISCTEAPSEEFPASRETGVSDPVLQSQESTSKYHFNFRLKIIYKTVAIIKPYTGVVLTLTEALESPTLPATVAVVVSAATFTTGVADSEMVIRGALTGVTGTGLEATPTVVDATSFEGGAVVSTSTISLAVPEVAITDSDCDPSPAAFSACSRANWWHLFRISAQRMLKISIQIYQSFFIATFNSSGMDHFDCFVILL